MNILNKTFKIKKCIKRQYSLFPGNMGGPNRTTKNLTIKNDIDQQGKSSDDELYDKLYDELNEIITLYKYKIITSYKSQQHKSAYDTINSITMLDVNSIAMFVACICGIVGMYCDYKNPNDRRGELPDSVCFAIMGYFFVVFSPILIPGGCLILIDMTITNKKNKE